MGKVLVALCVLAAVAVVSAQSCGEYGKSASFKRKGNGGKDFDCVWILKSDLSEPGKYMKGEKDADVAITKTMACAFDKMRAAASKDGVKITIASGFRSIPRQQYFWDCYRCGVGKSAAQKAKCCNNGNLAAAVGTSNHGGGTALDLNTDCGNQGPASAPWANPPKTCNSSKVYKWLLTNGSKYGFIRTVKNEPYVWVSFSFRART